MSRRHESLPEFILISSVIFALPVLSSCVSVERYHLSEPKASDDVRIWDFGRVKEGEILEHSFILRNSQDKPLVISNLDTSCGCTVSETPKKHLSPGEDTLIKVKFHTQGYSGPVQQHVYVYSDSVSTPVIKFSVKAEVVK